MSKSWLALLFLAGHVYGQSVATRTLSATVPTKIVLSPALTTTLLFPGPLSGTFGLGLVSAGNGTGVIQCEHPDGSNILVLHALTPDARVLATVLLNNKLYVLDLETQGAPDVAVTLVGDGTEGTGTTVTPEEIKAARPKYDAELLQQFVRFADNAPVARKLYPDLYTGYESRNAQYTSDSGNVKTTVTMIHRFSKQDAIVLQGTVQNETAKPIEFDGRSATVLVGTEVHPVKLLDCKRPIPAKATVPINVVIQGDYDGSRANLDIVNEMRIILPEPDGLRTTWALMQGKPVDKDTKIPVPLPEATPSIPLSQTSPPVKSN